MAGEAGATSAASYTLQFHGNDFIVDIAHDDETLTVSIEQKDTGDRWMGDFSAKYIEEITGRTGSFKRFPVFVKMLASGLEGKSDSVFVDLLTYADLEMLKHRKGGRKPGTSASSASLAGASAKGSKRYMILTYAAEFDRVHYPLPLAYDANPDPQVLLATIRRLRLEVQELRMHPGGSPSAELQRLADENQSLRARLGAGGGDDSVASERLREVEDRLARTERESARQIRTLRKECERLASEVDAKSVEVRELREELEAQRRAAAAASATVGPKEARLLKKNVQRLEEELAAERKAAKAAALRQRRELGALQEELRKAKLAEAELVRMRRRGLPPPAAHTPPRGAASARSSPARSRASSPGQSRPGSAPPAHRRPPPPPSSAHGASPQRGRPSLPDGRTPSRGPPSAASSRPSSRPTSADWRSGRAPPRETPSSARGHHHPQQPERGALGRAQGPAGSKAPGAGAAAGRKGGERERERGAEEAPTFDELERLKAKLRRYAVEDRERTPRRSAGPAPAAPARRDDGGGSRGDSPLSSARLQARLDALQDFLSRHK